MDCCSFINYMGDINVLIMKFDYNSLGKFDKIYVLVSGGFEVWNPIALKNELISEFLKDLKKIRPIYPSYVSELIEKWEEKLK